ncbi:MAG: hypothetical protein ACRC6X_05780 [Culicoidibacterales bacterium]
MDLISATIFYKKVVEISSASRGDTYEIDNTEYTMPYRVNIEDSDTRGQLSPEERQLLWTRNPDGFIRQKAVMNLFEQKGIKVDYYPFIIRLVGEYVDEISVYIYENRNKIKSKALHKFVTENECFIKQQEIRAISYWNAHYRKKYLHYEDTPAIRFLRWLKKHPETARSHGSQAVLHLRELQSINPLDEEVNKDGK